MKTLLSILVLCLGVGAQTFAADLENEDVNVTTDEKPVEKPAVTEKPSQTVKDEAGAGDTYNFYFQKGSGPGTVEQGGGAQAPAPTPAAPAIAAPAPKMVEELTNPRFELQAMMIMAPQKSGTGIALGSQFNMSPQWGLQFHLISLNMDEPHSDSSSMSAEGISNSSSKLNSFGGSLALAYSPFITGTARVPVRVSGLLGTMFVTETRDVTTNDMSAISGINSNTRSQKESKTVAFVGLSATGHISKHFGLVGSAKLTSDPAYSQVGIGAALLF